MRFVISKTIEADSEQDAELDYNENIPEFGDFDITVLNDEQEVGGVLAE